MTLRPLVPQSPARIKWQRLLQTLLCQLADCANGDAQGLIEAQGVEVDEAYAAGKTPTEVAMQILNAPLKGA